MGEPGFDLHEWNTRWQDLQDAIADDPGQALPEVVRLIAEMLGESGFDIDEPVTAEGDDPDIFRGYVAARDVAAAVDRGDAVDREDVDDALDDLRDIYDYITEDRASS
jgi:hypothetical protein